MTGKALSLFFMDFCKRYNMSYPVHTMHPTMLDIYYFPILNLSSFEINITERTDGITNLAFENDQIIKFCL